MNRLTVLLVGVLRAEDRSPANQAEAGVFKGGLFFFLHFSLFFPTMGSVNVGQRDREHRITFNSTELELSLEKVNTLSVKQREKKNTRGEIKRKCQSTV